MEEMEEAEAEERSEVMSLAVPWPSTWSMARWMSPWQRSSAAWARSAGKPRATIL